MMIAQWYELNKYQGIPVVCVLTCALLIAKLGHKASYFLFLFSPVYYVCFYDWDFFLSQFTFSSDILYMIYFGHFLLKMSAFKSHFVKLPSIKVKFNL